MALPNITIVGNTTAPSELRFTPSGKAVANFTVVANKRKRTDTGGWEDAGRSPFINVSVWGEDGEAVAEQLSAPGMQVIVTGQLLAREYEARDGSKRESLELDFATVGVVVRAKRGERSRPNGQQQQADPWAQQPAHDPWVPQSSEPGF